MNKLFFSIKYKIFLFIFLPFFIISLTIMIYGFFYDRENLFKNYYNLRDNTENNLIKTILLIEDSYEIIENQWGTDIKKIIEDILLDKNIINKDLNDYKKKYNNIFDISIISKYGKVIYSTDSKYIGFDLKKYPIFYKKFIQLFDKNEIIIDKITKSHLTGELKLSGYKEFMNKEYILEITLLPTFLTKISDNFSKLPQELKKFNKHLESIDFFDIYGINHNKTKNISEILHIIIDEEIYEVFDNKNNLIKRYLYIENNRKDRFTLSESGMILEIIYNIKPIIKKLNNLIHLYLLISVVFILIIIVIVIILSRTITKPLLVIDETVKKFTNKDFSLRIPIKGNDELSRLAIGINTMAEEIQIYTEYLEKLVEARNKEIKAEKNKSEKLLLNILPEPIAKRLKDNSNIIIADKFEDASILFADIVGFTRLSEKLNAEGIVAILNEIFSVFDKMVDDYKLEKIKTIGDCYMIAGNLPENNPEHLDSMIKMGLSMLSFMKEYEQKNEVAIHLRIGINTGPVVAGIIGTKKFIYDVWGDTVNTASRMESHGIIDKIHVSESVYLRMKDKYKFEERGTIEVKGKGKMKTYILG